MKFQNVKYVMCNQCNQIVIYIIYIYILTLMSHHSATRPGFSGIDRFRTAPPHGSMMPCGKAPRRDVGPPLCPICWESLGSCLGLVRMVSKKMPETSWILKKYTLKIMVRWRDIHRISEIFDFHEFWDKSNFEPQNFKKTLPLGSQQIWWFWSSSSHWRSFSEIKPLALPLPYAAVTATYTNHVNKTLNYQKSPGKSGWPVSPMMCIT